VPLDIFPLQGKLRDNRYYVFYVHVALNKALRKIGYIKKKLYQARKHFYVENDLLCTQNCIDNRTQFTYCDVYKSNTNIIDLKTQLREEKYIAA